MLKRLVKNSLTLKLDRSAILTNDIISLLIDVDDRRLLFVVIIKYKPNEWTMMDKMFNIVQTTPNAMSPVIWSVVCACWVVEMCVENSVVFITAFTLKNKK